jgi:hypothetical protein
MAAAAKDGQAILHRDARETVSYHQLAPGAALAQDLPGGGELLVLSGGLTEGDDALTQGSWLRLPMGAQLQATAGPEGATIWMKTGHIGFAKPPAT